MMPHNHRLGDTVLKANEDFVLWQTEKGIVKILKDSLACPIKFCDQIVGYILHGNGKLTLDTIIETREGAVGKSVERDLKEPFIVLGDIKEKNQKLTAASIEDLKKKDYASTQEFIAKAEKILQHFSEKMEKSNLGVKNGFIFAFSNEIGKFDTLIAKDEKLIYTTPESMFILNDDKAIWKTPSEVILIKDQKVLIARKNCCKLCIS